MSAAWMVEALIASTLLMAFVVAVRKPAQRAFGPQLAYWLWALPVLRMVTPPLPTDWRESAAAPISAASETVMVFIAPATAAVAGDPVAPAFPWLATLAALWGVGALAFFVWHGLAHAAYVRRIVSPPARHERLADGTTLVESDEAIGPVAFGVLRRFVAVPRDFAERYDEDERRLALAHELGHHARGDLIANWIALGMLAAHWFNPFAWVAYRKFRADQEMANDARVLAALPPIERHAYACAILKAANGRAITAACHLHTIEDLKGRLRMLKAHRKSRRVLLAGATGIMALTVAGLGLTASGAAAEQIRTAAAEQVPELAAPPAPPAPSIERKHKVVVVKDGDSRTYEGAEAEAYLADHPEIAQRVADGMRIARRHTIVIRDKDGKRRRYVGAEADAYLRAHPDMRPPLPPLAALPPVPPLLPLPPLPPVSVVTTDADGAHTTHVTRDGKAYAFAYAPRVTKGNCGSKQSGSFIISETDKDGAQRMIICKNRIERFAADQARFGAAQARLGAAQARLGKLHALQGLRAGESAIQADRSLSDARRAQALAGIAEARAALEAEAAAEND